MVLAAALIGLAVGWLTARKGARRLDRAHRAGVFAILFGIMALIGLVIASRIS